MDVALHGGPLDGGGWKQVPPHQDELVVPGLHDATALLYRYQRDPEHPSRFLYVGPAEETTP